MLVFSQALLQPSSPCPVWSQGQERLKFSFPHKSQNISCNHFCLWWHSDIWWGWWIWNLQQVGEGLRCTQAVEFCEAIYVTFQVAKFPIDKLVVTLTSIVIHFEHPSCKKCWGTTVCTFRHRNAWLQMDCVRTFPPGLKEPPGKRLAKVQRMNDVWMLHILGRWVGNRFTFQKQVSMDGSWCCHLELMEGSCL